MRVADIMTANPVTVTQRNAIRTAINLIREGIPAPTCGRPWQLSASSPIVTFAERPIPPSWSGKSGTTILYWITSRLALA